MSTIPTESLGNSFTSKILVVTALDLKSFKTKYSNVQ